MPLVNEQWLWGFCGVAIVLGNIYFSAFFSILEFLEFGTLPPWLHALVSCGVAHCREGLIYVFRGLFDSIKKIFFLAGRLGARLGNS